MKPFFHLLIACSLLIAGIARSQVPGTLSGTPADDQRRNVILIIGDGMDEHQITIARNYLKGATGKLTLDKLPLRSVSQVLSIEDQINGNPIYVADSANTATSMATGVVTSRGRLATTAGSDQDIPTIAELAIRAGYRAGMVTSASVTDATTAAFATHISYRMCENPELVERIEYNGIYLGGCPQDARKNGGPGAISEQLADSPLHVILGGGSKHFTVMAEGQDKTVLDLAQDNGFQIVRTPAELATATSGGRLLGLFSDSTMPVRLQGENGRTAEQPEPSLLNRVHEYLGEVALPDIMTCEPNPEFSAMPTLREMTDAALEHLSTDNRRGFFLMVESASIDKQSHERKPCGSIGEVEQLDEALDSALAFARRHRNTLILVTADHSQAAQLIPHVSLFARYPIPIYTPGYLARIATPEGGVMDVNYATSTFMMEEHTGAAVPLFANSAGKGKVPSYVTQPEIFNIMKAYLKL
ncbi:alkaline phosphatase [Seongchinamella unica]|uniref:Alkaline phosphatase n=1 Tax=Seongchinamella unica TaxID=2547392 RepID=A0A4V2ZWY1_9GAMM|nr:alkaline phosphatase [Seongchinamella unica]TDG12118.1 alkaline phosphatase [Seongchinamella unica]